MSMSFLQYFCLEIPRFRGVSFINRDKWNTVSVQYLGPSVPVNAHLVCSLRNTK